MDDSGTKKNRMRLSLALESAAIVQPPPSNKIQDLCERETQRTPKSTDKKSFKFSKFQNFKLKVLQSQILCLTHNLSYNIFVLFCK